MTRRKVKGQVKSLARSPGQTFALKAISKGYIVKTGMQESAMARARRVAGSKARANAKSSDCAKAS